MADKQKLKEPLDYKDAMNEFYEEFPFMRKKVMLFVKSDFPKFKDQLVAASKFIIDNHKSVLNHDVTMQEFIKGQLYMYKYPESMDISYTKHNKEIHLVYPRNENDTVLEARNKMCGFLKAQDESSFPILKDKFNNKEIWHRFFLEHELGHSLTIMKLSNKMNIKRNTFDNAEDFSQNYSLDAQQMKECAADVYSVIRHYQRYGGESEFPVYMADLRAFGLITTPFADDIHMSVAAIDRIVEMNKAGQIMGLTPDESVDIAMKIAVEASYSNIELKAIKTEFKLKNRNKINPDPDSMVARLQTIGSKTTTPIVQQICTRLLDFIENNSNANQVDKNKLAKAKTKVGNNNFEDGGSLKNIFKQQVWRYKTRNLRRTSLPFNNKPSI